MHTIHPNLQQSTNLRILLRSPRHSDPSDNLTGHVQRHASDVRSEHGPAPRPQVPQLRDRLVLRKHRVRVAPVRRRGRVLPRVTLQRTQGQMASTLRLLRRAGDPVSLRQGQGDVRQGDRKLRLGGYL